MEIKLTKQLIRVLIDLGISFTILGGWIILEEKEEKDLRRFLIDKYRNEGKISYYEYKLLIDIYNKELKKRGGLKLQNIKNWNVIEKINQLIY